MPGQAIVAALLSLLASAALPGPATGVAGAPPELERVMRAQRLPASAVSLAVMDPDTGHLVFGQNVDTPRSPASTIKLLTTFAGLDILGPAFTWHTRALLHGSIRDGVLGGDLILQGGGDPYMTLERWWSFAHQLRGLGLKSIRGDVIIDDSGFSLPYEDPGAFDGRPNRAYNVLPDALMVNFQAVEFSLVPNPVSRSIDVIADPAPANLIIDNRMRYVDGGRCSGAASRVDFQVASARWDRVVFSGALSASCTPRSFTRVLLTPADYAYGTFAALWRELGGDIGGGLRVEAAPPDARLFLDYDSLTLGEIVRLTNKYSSNLMARHLLLTIGAARFGAPATPDKGLAAIAEWSRTRGLALDDADFGNGSGLSRTTHVSVLQLASVLNAAYHSRYAPEYLASLPLAGVDGTLRSRMKNSPAGAVRLKTGHIDGVSGVAGYVTTAAKTYIVVCLINDGRADYGAGEPVHAALVDWVLANL
jgi:D-alanyl-D-alanine carboxypeptidase/D-alanyl-D-alanine-endopeptidase (penicillin-binding protein 4)